VKRRLVLSALLAVVIAAAWLGYVYALPWVTTRSHTARLLAYLRNPAAHADWQLAGGTRCPGAPFLLPTDGLVGFGYDDAFRLGHRHQGFDIFGPTALGATPVYAAYAGYLTRLPEWISTVIIRIPQDPLDPSRQIWTYYTHMADPSGQPFISADFPPGTSDVPVAAGTLLGYQGNYSGDPAAPVGMHLHFSIVRDDGQGHFLNELEIDNTLDPSPYLGVSADRAADWSTPPQCAATP
jgi:murein DD-endopeptidase MepM/ murein hydrolase activator NlpD